MRTMGAGRWRAGALAAVSVAAVLGWAGAPSAGSAALAPTPTRPPTVPGIVEVPKVFQFYGIACPTTGACIGVGEQGVTRLGVIDAVTNHVPARPVTVRGTFSFGGVACPSAGYCVAIGQAGSHGEILPAATIVPIHDGTPGRVTKLPKVFLYGIGCGSTRSCWATGETTDFKHAVVVHLSGTHVVHVFRLRGVNPGAFYFDSSTPPTEASASGPAPVCASASDCLAVGTTGHVAKRVGTTGNGLIVTLASGQIVGKAKVPGTSRLDGIACSTASTCIATADPTNVYTTTSEGSVLPVNSGRPGALQQLQLTDEQVQLGPIACPAVGTCYVVTAGGVIVPVNEGVPATNATYPRFKSNGGLFDSVACQGSSCLAAGGEYVPPGNEAGVLFPF